MALLLPLSNAMAQDRTPVLRQTIVDLAYVLGESHALRQACHGADDQFWRLRMIKMVDAEQPDAALDRRLKESFNTGFAVRQGEHVTCAMSRAPAVAAAQRGRDLAGKLAKVMNQVRPGPAAEPIVSDEPPR